jgi:zinc protease
MSSTAFQRPLPRAIAVCALLLLGVLARAARAQEKIEFTEERLDNGMNVIYAPLRQTPVVHVRVVYEVGSRDERPDRQGFAHMFEHMMFRGSAHVAPEEHMKLVNSAGGSSNAFTSFDQTVYVNTVPANQLEMVLYLEADRMASFKVSDDIYKVERSVVAKEWGMNYNQPYFAQAMDALRVIYTKHPYQWTPLGNMEHLKAAPVSELQAFFNRYYVPNNATLVIAGDIDVPKAKELVRKYFAWVPAGPPITRDIPAEPQQTQTRRAEFKAAVPLAVVGIAYHLPPWRSDDHYALSLLATIVGGGESSRMQEALVNNDKPLCAQVMSGSLKLADPGLFAVGGAVLPLKDAGAVEKEMLRIIGDVVEKGVTPQELEKARTQARVGFINARKTADDIATRLGEEKVFGGDADRVNTELAKLEALKPQDVQAVARKYFKPEQATVVRVSPNLLGMLLSKKDDPSAKVNELEKAGVAPSTKLVEPRPVTFPSNYPQHPPRADLPANPQFIKGREAEVNGVRVIVMTDTRLPLAGWSLVMRRGSHSDPKGKEGLGSLTAALLRRGAGGMTYSQLNHDLESKGISIGVGSVGDYTELSGSCMTQHLDHAIERSRQVLLEPALDAAELEKLKAQEAAGLTAGLAEPRTVANRDLTELLFGDSPLGRHATPGSIKAIAIDDVKRHYENIYRPEGAFLVISGDVSFDRGKELAEKLLAGWKPGPLPTVDYELPAPPAQRRIVLVDNPEAKQTVIQMGVRAYDVHSDERYAGASASETLSSGIESRLGRYVRAKMGYAYYCVGSFSPDRHAGAFYARTETAFETTAPAIEAMFKVFGEMRAGDVTADELAGAKVRSAGELLMSMQTIEQQARQRTSAILNGFPDDYYDKYPERLGQVTAAQVRGVMDKYVRDDRMAIVVVAPKDKVLSQLQKLGEVEVRPMPAQRKPVAETK